MRKAIFIALAAASVSLFAGPGTSATGYGMATAALYRPISITANNGLFGVGSLYFGQFITDGTPMTATLTPQNGLSYSNNVTPLHNIHNTATFTVKSDAALTYNVTAAPALLPGNATIAPTVVSNAPTSASLIEGKASSIVTVGGTISVPANTYVALAPFSVTVTYN